MDLTNVPDDVRGADETPPDFETIESPEQLLRDGPIRERLLDVIAQLRDPTKVSTIAERTE